MSDGGVAGGASPEPRPPRWRAWLDQASAWRISAPAALGVATVAFATGLLVAAAVSTGPIANTNQAQQSAGGPWALFGKPRRADAARPQAPRPEGFAVWRTRVDNTGAQPQACIEFSRPLDPQRGYGDFVLVSPQMDGKPAATAKGDELCLSGLGFLDRRVTLLKGLPALSGESLADNAEVSFAFGEKPPYVGFVGGGVILPRQEADGVGIETVNVSRVRVEVWRVVDRNLVRKQISAPDPTGEGDYASDYGSDSAGDDGRLVWEGLMSVKGDPGQRTTTVFPLGAVLKDMKPGGYLIKVKDASGARGLKDAKKKHRTVVSDDEEGGDYVYDPNPPAQARRWVMFTDMALTAYQGSDGLDVVVRSLNSAKVLPGLRVALVAKSGEDLAEGRTDAQGRLRFDHPLLEGEAGGRARMVMAYGPMGDLAVLDLDRAPVDLSSQGVGGKAEAREIPGAVDAYVYADRGVYRPGETVHANALLRDRDARAVKDRKGFIVVRRPSGTEFARYRFEQTPLGSIGRDIALPKTAPRGMWSASVELDGIDAPAGSLRFDVEDFAPQRLDVKLQGREATPITGAETRLIDVNSRFLYGAPGAGLQTEGEARLSADPDPFPQFKGYSWGDQKTPFEEKLLELDRTVTDGEGRAVLHLSSFAGQGVPQPLQAAMTASVFEPGGRPVREEVKFKVRTLPLYLGVKTDMGDASGHDAPLVTLNVIAADAFGRRVAAQGVSYTLISETWNYDWFRQGDRWQWRRSSRDVVVQKGALTIGAQAQAKIARRLGWGDYRLEVEGPSGAKTVTRFAAGWGEPAKDMDAPDVARVSAGTRAYRQGDSVEITLKAPYAGEAQVAVATDRLIDFKALSIGEKGGSVRFRTNAAWGGGAYVLVSVIQPRDPATHPKPRRALGVVYVPLDAANRRLDVAVGAPAKASSKAALDVPLTIKGQGFHGHAYVTLAAVDEGILRITHFQSPDPAKWYFGKKALSLSYRDDYGRLLDPNLGAPANVNFGGDGTGGAGLSTTPIRTIALWSGVVQTGPDGRALIHLPAPDFNGELRLMAVAWTDEALGSGAQPITVREKVVADLNLPRFFAPGDKAQATLELHNLEGRPGGYLATLTSQGGPVASFQKLFQLALGQRIAEHIPLAAPNRAGVGTIGFRVQGPAFATGRDYPIETRLGWGPITRATVALQKPGESYTPTPDLLAGLAAGDARMEVSYSPFRGFDPAPIAAALKRYPYGCTEQLVSGAYPLLYGLELTPPAQRKGQAGLNQAIGRLLDRQSMDGAFGLWRVGDAEADPWLGAYTTDFLIEARRLGAPVPQEAIDRALGAMRLVSRPDGFENVAYRMNYPDWWYIDRDHSQSVTRRMRQRAAAYALYVLAKGGQGDLPRLRWWHDVQMKSEPSPLARAQVAAGLALMGDRARARDGFEQAIQVLGYKEDHDWYQSPLRDLAGVIALAYEAGEPDLARRLQPRLENSVKNPDALNTQEEARLLQAAHAMLEAAGPMRVAAQGAIAVPQASAAPRWAVGRLAVAHFANQGSGALWRTVTVTGEPIAAPAPASDGLTVTKTFFTLKGEYGDPAAMKQGQRLIVLIHGRSLQARTTQLVVDDALPAGWEIESTLSEDDAGNGPFKFLGKLSYASLHEARDDRFVGSTSTPGDKEFAFAYVIRAVTPGDFLLPGVEARDMYRPTVVARTSARRTTIAPGG